MTTETNNEMLVERFQATIIRLKHHLKLIRANDRPPSKHLCRIIEQELAELDIEIARLKPTCKG